MLHRSKLVKLILAVSSVALLSTSVHADSDSDMDHGIDFDFDKDVDQDMIPVTPKEQEDDAPVDSNSDSDLIVPHDSEDGEQDDESWFAYLEFAEDHGKDIAYRIYKQVTVRLARFFLTAEHKPAKSNMQAFKYGFYDGAFKLQPRAHSNCLTEGPTYLRALTHFVLRMFKNRLQVSAQEEFTFEDILQGFMNKCTL